MRKLVALLAVAVSLSACDAISTVTQGFTYAKNVENDLQTSTGLKPAVSFNWHNGRFEHVTVTFPQLYEAKPLREVAAIVRAAIAKEFKQTPNNIVIAFSTGAGDPGRTAQLSGTQTASP